MSLDSATFRQVLGRFASGVTVVTVRKADGSAHGMTASAFSSVSLEPPLVLVCIAKKALTHNLVQETGKFAINILAADQQPVSDHFAGRRPEGVQPFDGIPYRAEVTGAPIIEGALAYTDCTLYAAHDAGDHTIFVGKVERAGVQDLEAKPLLYWAGGYRALAQEAEQKAG